MVIQSHKYILLLKNKREIFGLIGIFKTEKMGLCAVLTKDYLQLLYNSKFFWCTRAHACMCARTRAPTHTGVRA